jgi:hypothetical protein
MLKAKHIQRPYAYGAIKFLSLWVVVNVFALSLGWQVGGNDLDLLSPIERAKHNAVLGSVIGLSQSCMLLIFQPSFSALFPRRWLLLLWGPLSAFGFVFGVWLLHRALGRIAISSQLQAGILFAIFIGAGFTLAQAVLLLGRGKRVVFIWLVCSGLTWLVVEVYNALAGFEGLIIPITGALIGLGTGIGLLWAQATAQAQRRAMLRWR